MELINKYDNKKYLKQHLEIISHFYKFKINFYKNSFKHFLNLMPKYFFVIIV